MGAARLLRVALWGLLLPLISAKKGLLIASNNDTPPKIKKYCIEYDTFTSLPPDSSGIPSTELILLDHTMFCNPSDVGTVNVSGKALAVKRGNCTFLEKAQLAQSHGAKILLIVSDSPLTSPNINSSIPVALISKEAILEMKSTLGNINVILYSPPMPFFDYSLVVIFLLAVLTVVAGSYWSGMVELENLKASVSSGSFESQGKTEENVVLSPPHVVVFVAISCAVLLLLYFFYKYLVYFFIAIFCISSTASLFICLAALVEKIPYGRCRVTVYNNSIEVRLVLLFVISIAAVGVWVVFRKEDRWVWVLQDVLEIAFCVHVLKVLKLPHYKSCVILLVLLLVYDVFFVFITPFLTKSGESVMVQVASGPPDATEKNDGNLLEASAERSAPHENLPLVIKVPRLQFFSIPTCDVQFSILGLGDIVIPGVLVAYCHRFDVLTNTSSVYFISTAIAYAAGMVITFVALSLMKMPQPALLYLAPATLIVSAAVAFYRKEMKKFWNGTTYQVLDP